MDSEAGRVEILGVERRHEDAAISAARSAGCYRNANLTKLAQAFARFERDLGPDNGLREALERLSKSVEHAIDMADESGGMGWYAALDELRAGNVAAVSALQPNTGERDDG